MEHLGWFPVVMCALVLLLWVTACTLITPRTNRPQTASTHSSAPPSSLTITVFDQLDPTARPTRRNVVRTAAIASPSPSPTPTQYTVREGDTLLEIALRYEITLEALLAANRQVDPLSLQIGDVLVIPIGDESVTPPAPDAPPAPLNVTAPTCYSTVTGGTLCLGLVENTQDQPAGRVSVHVQLVDHDGESLAEQVTTLEQSYIAVGESAPYRALFPDIPEEIVASVVVTLETATLTGTIDRRYVALDVQNEQLQPDGLQYVFSAEIQNPTERRAAPPRAVVTLWDGSNQVYAYRVWQAEDNLLPGTQTAFQVAVLPLDNTDVDLRYNLHVEARALD